MRAIHRTLGLVLGVWFALVGLTGSILVYEEEFDAWLNPALWKDSLASRGDSAIGYAKQTAAQPQMQPATRPATQPLIQPLIQPVSRILEAAADQFPLSRVERIHYPRDSHGVYRLVIRIAPHLRVESPRVEAMFGASSGEFMGVRDAERAGLSRPYLIRAVYEFHRNVLLGPFGANIVGIAGFLLLVSTVTGFLVAVPRNRSGWRRVISVKLRAGTTRILFDIHRSGGAMLFVLMLLATSTGITLVYLNYVREAVSVFSPVAPFPTVPWRETPLDDWPSLTQVAEGVQRAYPGHSIVELHVPSRLTTGYLFYLRAPGDVHRLGDTIAWVHPGSGEILLERGRETRSRGETFMHWLYPLHSGAAFGDTGKIIMCFAGITPLFLVLSGLWVWTRKRRAQAFERSRRERLNPMTLVNS